jgi:L-aspartate oxidase
MASHQAYDIVIVGGGIAGLSTALRLPASLQVALLTKGQLGESNTRYAQGGLTVALGEDDSPQLHAQDTLVAGAGLCDETAVRILTEQAPSAVQWLIEIGARFDRARPGSDEHATAGGLLLGREAAHSRWRVLHAGGDATGAEIERALTMAARRRSSITLYEESYVERLLVEQGACTGLVALDRSGRPFTIEAHATVLANGGAGGLWLHTSNPAGATADGLALAWQAGASLTDLEFMQFHPTVLVAGGASHLISEAVRGEGAYLRNHAGERFMVRYSELAELAPRDIVARAILSEMLAEGVDHQYLDLRHLPATRVYERFPTISTICRSYGLDLASDLLPIAPAAHYCMGGVMTNTQGQTSLPGLYAVGEVACTGVHGANRLASNSLLEGLVFGLRLADGLAGKLTEEVQPSRRAISIPVCDDLQRYTSLLRISPDRESIAAARRELRQVMWQYVSLRRDEEGLLEARARVNTLAARLLSTHTRTGSTSLQVKPVATPLAGVPSNCARGAHGTPTRGVAPAYSDSLKDLDPATQDAFITAPAWHETVNMFKVAELVIAAALQRRESRGSHWRGDHEALDPSLTGRHYVLQPVSIQLTEQSFQSIGMTSCK